MTWAGRLVLPVVALSLACAGRQVEVTAGRDPTVRPVAGAWQDFPTQRIFRVRYQDDADVVSFRLVGWLTSPEIYRLKAMDPVGRMLWTIDLDAPKARILDFRSKRSCSTEDPVSVPAVGIGSLSLPDFALVLVGLPPTPFEQRHAGSGDRTAGSEDGWSLTVERSGEGVDAWTLWTGPEPVLWFRRGSQSSILSHRNGVQLRWKETHREALTRRPAALEVPDGFVTVECSDLAPPSGMIRMQDPLPPSG